MSYRFEKSISINDLHLDTENPRLPFSLRGKNETDIISYMLQYGSIPELMLSIGENGFFQGEALLVVEVSSGFKVVEGNRRLTAVKLLNDVNKAPRSKLKVEEALNKIIHKNKIPTHLPCIVFEDENEILKYLGYRHITGIKNWKALEKARYIHRLFNVFLSENSSASESDIYAEIARSIGSKSIYVARILTAFSLYQYIEENDFFDIPNLDDKSFYFVNLSDSLNRSNLKTFLLVDPEDQTVKFNKNNLEEWTTWLFKENEGITRVSGKSEDLALLNNIVGSEYALAAFRDGKKLTVASEYAEDFQMLLGDFISSSLEALTDADQIVAKAKNLSKLQIKTFTENLQEIEARSQKILSFLNNMK